MDELANDRRREMNYRINPNLKKLVVEEFGEGNVFYGKPRQPDWSIRDRNEAVRRGGWQNHGWSQGLVAHGVPTVRALNRIINVAPMFPNNIATVNPERTVFHSDWLPKDHNEWITRLLNYPHELLNEHKDTMWRVRLRWKHLHTIARFDEYLENHMDNLGLDPVTRPIARDIYFQNIRGNYNWLKDKVLKKEFFRKRDLEKFKDILHNPQKFLGGKSLDEWVRTAPEVNFQGALDDDIHNEKIANAKLANS
jgi:hypothetical protein